VIASLVQSGFDLHWLARGLALQVCLVLVTVSFLTQAVASVFSYLARDGAAGAVLGVLATCWLAIGLIHIAGVPGHRSGALGLMLLAGGVVIALGAISVAVAKPLPGAVFGLTALRFVLAGVYQLGAEPAWRDAAGILGLVIVGLAAYCVLAFELESQLGHALLPTLRRGPGRAALSGDPAASIGDVLHDPGVRRTS
jgi:hypothetical protein